MTEEKNPTQNHDLPRPDSGTFEGTWGTDVMNDDMTAKLEERLVARDTESNLSNYEAYEDAIFIATDTGAVYDGNGTSWEKASRQFESISTESLDSIDGYEDASSDRSLDTWYQNDSNSDLEVSVTVISNENDTDVRLLANVSESQSQNRVKYIRQTLDPSERTIISFRVPAGYYYRIETSDADVDDFEIDTVSMGWAEQ